MASHKCPLCGQTLHKSMDEAELQRRLSKIGKAEGKHLLHDLERKQKLQLTQAEERGRKEGERRSHYEVAAIQAQMSKKDRQHALHDSRVQRKMEEMQRQMERQTSEERGEVSEAEVFNDLKAAFPTDDIVRITKAAGGADILHRVIADSKEVGSIVYECKNALEWNYKWITKAKQYQSRYQTPWVIIAAKSLPKRRKWFAVEKKVPVIDLHLVVTLAEIVRSAVIESGHLRMSQAGRHTKADQMFDYILSNHFISRFNGVANAVTELRDLQTKEKKRHTDTWTAQTHLFETVDDGQREINSHIRSIAETRVKPRLKVVVGNG